MKSPSKSSDRKSELLRDFQNELEKKEKEFCKLLRIKHVPFTKSISTKKARVGLMTLYDFYKTKLKVFKETPKYFTRLEWGIKYHFLGVARAAYALGKKLKLSESELNSLIISAFFHDIAKIKYDNDFFIRKLSHPDQRILNHSIESFQLMLTYCGYFNHPVLEGILQHHEQYDGTGYPLHLRGNQIHLFGRIIAVVDAYSAMMETREFSPRKETVKEVLDEIDMCKYSQFDPDIADAFIKSNPGAISKKGN